MISFSKQSVPRIEELYVRNYRALKDLQPKNLTPLTVFLGLMEAVNNWAQMGKWNFYVCRDPQMLGKELEWVSKESLKS